MEESAKAAEVIKSQVSVIKESAEELVAQITVDTEIAMGKLSEAKPALDEAEAALNVHTDTKYSGLAFAKLYLFFIRL